MKLTLVNLLKWAQKNEHYIEIYGNGNVMLQYADEYEWEESVCENTLYLTLLKAYRQSNKE